MINDNRDYVAVDCYANGLRFIRKGECYVKKTRAFDELDSITAMVFLLHLSGFSHTHIWNTLKISKSSINRYIKTGYAKYPRLKTL